jgi:hypothetical protein
MYAPRVLGLGLLVASGCATAPHPEPAPEPTFMPTTFATTKVTVAAQPGQRGCLVQSHYTEGDVSKILRLRDEGESLKRVAAEVGGSRQEVKCVERSVHAAKRDARLVQRK